MRKAYIVLAHKHPGQLCRLLTALDDGLSTFFVHIDKARPLQDFSGLADFGQRLVMVKRENSDWARTGIVRATLNAMAMIDERREAFDRVILLSGQDYPIKSNDYINGFLARSPHSIFMDHWEIPNFEKWKHRGGMSRIDKYFLGTSRREVTLARAANLMGIIVPPLRRKLPRGLRPYGGWMWWILDRAAVRCILQYVERNPDYLRYHRHTFAPDEVFFQTILLNCGDEKLLSSICNDDMRYVVWHGSESHPEILTKDRMPALLSSNDLFARKFDVDVDSEVLDLIDRALKPAG